MLGSTVAGSVLVVLLLLGTACGQDPTAVCRDGTESFSRHASGTCSWHGGVRQWVNYPEER